MAQKTPRSPPAKPPSHTNKPRSAKPLSLYLLCYNLFNASLWLRILVGVITKLGGLQQVLLSLPVVVRHGFGGQHHWTRVYTDLERWTRWTQTLQMLEIIHASIGLVRSPVSTTFIQVFTRTFHVWAICYSFPDVVAVSPGYAAMLFAWSMADVVRYLYFGALVSGRVDGWLFRLLKWMRYTLFLFLYPVGIAGEWWIIWEVTRKLSATPVESARHSSVVILGGLYFILGLYTPGALKMFIYMAKQRRKSLGRG